MNGQNEGLVEVRPADSWTWGGVCGEHFDLRDADVVCRMLGYIWANRFYSLRSHGLAYMADIRCDGNETSLFKCSYAGWGIHDCAIYASVVCDTSRIRLIGGSGPNEGRVEVRPEDSVNWGTVCHNQFDMKDADVICRMLGYPNATQVRNDAYFGQDSSRIRLVPWRWINGPDEGLVEVRPADSWTWGRVCAEHFDLRDADVVCRMLGYIWYGLAYMADIRCDGNETSLFKCSYAGWESHVCAIYASVVCGTLINSYLNFHHVYTCICLIIYLDTSRIRLIGGSGPNEGRVEVRSEDSVNWGTVCHNQFDMKDADVICRMLGYPNATQVRNDAYFGQGTGPIYMADLRCDGNESSIFDCPYAGWTIHDCDHGQDAGVVCRTDVSRIRLVEGSGPTEGRVEVRPADSSRWGTVCHNGFDLKDAEVVCRMLGYPNAYRLRPNGYFGI
ncbi:PREDICTED: deleted in malignant brain tumors 1 protein-like, partial [Branchiostoma belcheri]|uniref:Deleted in malignant brain tumors 1 protein-like n=1 Tax=Branchiostoma belcheri TaxID=7741 RepID=A0A6P5A0H8_BRABE